MRPFNIVLTCEHAGKNIPGAFKYLFYNKEKILETHQGWDIGAFDMAQEISKNLKARLFDSHISRLLVDCNRSTWNKEIFSDFSRNLDRSVKGYLLAQYYDPYRLKVERYIASHCRYKPVLHVSIHTFTPVLHGIERLVDVGLLFDESRNSELNLCQAWQRHLKNYLPDKNILLNVPYNGADDGFTSYLRKKFSGEQYMGIELEINQKWVGAADLNIMINQITEGLEAAMDDMVGAENMMS